MKKSLSLLLSSAMVFGAFASAAYAADNTLTTAQKYQWFLDNKILKGDTSGDPRLDANLTRAEFATIAVAVAGLTPATSGQTFADVNSKQWYYGAIEAAAKAGLVNGVGQGKFDAKSNVTLEQIIKVADLMAGVKAVDGATVDGSDAWAGPYIKAAIDAGLIAAGGNYKAQATRGQTVDVAYAVASYKSVPTLSGVTATANADDTITVAGKVTGKADSVKVAIGTKDAVAATLKDDGTFTFTSAKQAAGTYNLTVTAYDGTKASAAATATATIDSFKVASVTVLNATQIAVKFNKTVLEGIATNGAGVNTHYTLTDSHGAVVNPTATGITISDDKTTATLTFATPFNADAYGTFDVKDINSASGIGVSEYKQSIYLNDTTPASVTGITFQGTVATVQFSEPLSNEGAVSVDGVQISGVSTINYDTTDLSKGKLYIKGWDKGSTHTLDIVSFADTAGKTADYSTTVNVPNDTTAPTITSVAVNGTNVVVTFSEDVQDLSGAAALKHYVDFKVNSGAVDTATAETYDSTAHTATLDLSGSVSGSFANVSLALTGYKDYAGLAGSEVDKSLTLVKDTTAPAYQGVSVSGHKILVKFNEDVKESAPGAVGGFTTINFTDTNGYRTTVTGTTSVGYDVNNDGDTADSGENNYLVIDLGSISTGTYSVSISGAGASFTDAAGNNVGNLSFSTSATTSGSTGVIQLTSASQLSNSKLEFDFTPTYSLTLADLKPANFLINGKALPDTTNLYYADSARTQVIAEIPAGTIPVNGTRTLSVANIVDGSGNTLDTNNNSKTVSLTENTAPKAVSAAIVTNTVAQVKFSENLAANGAVSGIEVWVNGSKVTTAFTASTTGTDNVLTIDFGSTSTFAIGQSVVIKVAGSNLVDQAANGGNAAADGQVTVS